MQWLGLRWAAKEAAYKALYPEHRLKWHDVQISKSIPSSPPPSHPWSFGLAATPSFISPKPSLTWCGSVQGSHDESKLSLPVMHLSVSHDGDYLLAFVVAEQSI
ncbi:hypothetical protein OC845_000997 [Tilletia horrida]|nr:hypothetical protein OC845_000997 [Tilletia horrida]